MGLFDALSNIFDKEKNKEAISNINKTGTVDGSPSGVHDIDRVVKDNTNVNNLAGADYSSGSKVKAPTYNSTSYNLAGLDNSSNSRGLVKDLPTLKDVYTSDTAQSYNPDVAAAHLQRDDIKRSLAGMADSSTQKANQVANALGLAANTVKDYWNGVVEETKDEIRQARLGQAKETEMAKADEARAKEYGTVTQEDYNQFYNPDNTQVDFDKQLKDLYSQQRSLMNISNTMAQNNDGDINSVSTNAELNRINEQIENVKSLKRKRDAFEETNILNQLKASGDTESYNYYRDYFSHRDDTGLERVGNAAKHLISSTANEVPTIVDQAQFFAKANIANQGIDAAREAYESGELTKEEYVEILGKYDENIKKAQAEYGDSISQEIRKVVDQYGANTYYGTEDVEKFLLQAGESTAQFLLHYAIGKGVSALTAKENVITQAGEALAEELGIKGATADEIRRLGLNKLGGDVATITMSGAGMTEKVNQLLDEGYDIQTAYQNGLFTGLVSYATEKIGMDNFVESLGTRVSTDIFGNVLKSRAVSGFFSEGGEELIEGMVDPFIDSVTLGKDYEVDGTELLMAFLLGGASGFVMSGGAVAINYANNEIARNKFVNDLVKNGARNRANTISQVNAVNNLPTDQIGRLIINNEKQLNMVKSEMETLERNLSDMTPQQYNVYTEVKEIADRAIADYDAKQQVKGVTFESDLVETPTFESNNQTMLDTLTVDYNKEIQEINTLNNLQSKVNEDVDQVIKVENNILMTSQEILNRNGYNIDAELFSKMNSRKQNDTLVALDFSKLMGINTRITDDAGIREYILEHKPDIAPSELEKAVRGANAIVDDEGRIIINGLRNPVLSSLSHELTHGTESSRYYPILRDLVKSKYEKSGVQWKDVVDKKISDYSAIQDLNNDQAEKEVVAEAMEKYLADEDFINDLIKYNYSLASRIWQNIRSLGDNSETVKIRNAFEKAFADNFGKTGMRDSLAFSANGIANSSSEEDIARVKEVARNAVDENNEIKPILTQIQEMRSNPNGYGLAVVPMNDSLNFAGIDGEFYFGSTLLKNVENIVDDATLADLLDNIPENILTASNYNRGKTLAKEVYVDYKGQVFVLHLRKKLFKSKFSIDTLSSFKNPKEIADYIESAYEKGDRFYQNEKSNQFFLGTLVSNENLIKKITSNYIKPSEEEIVKRPKGWLSTSARKSLANGMVMDGTFTNEDLRLFNQLVSEKGIGTSLDSINELQQYAKEFDERKEWHHTGENAEPTSFYSIEDLANNATKEKIDYIVGLDTNPKKLDSQTISEEATNTTGSETLTFSYKRNGDIETAQDELYEQNREKLIGIFERNGQRISDEDMTRMLGEAHQDMRVMADLMEKNSNLLPTEVIGKVLLKDASYGYSVENSTKCPRTLAYDELTNMVSEKVGRPLTAIESFLVSQKLYSIAVEPQCLYCYVALDRKSYNEFVGRYIDQRDQAIQKYIDAGKPKLPKTFSAAKNDALFNDFLDGRKATENMWSRYKSWINAYNNGEKLLTKKDVASDWSREDVQKGSASERAQLKDMLNYAQSASWAKKSYEYRAYFDDIRKLSQKKVNELNEHYGLRWYSFNDYTPAYILENMQQFTDAALKGLKGLAYTKDTDFARIFAPTGVNINISMYATMKDGKFVIDPLQSANLEEAIELRNKYPNVGIVVTATNDDTIKWAMDQDWTDVVIPFHIVRTGSDIAQYYKWSVYNSEQNDTVINDEVWKGYVESLTGVAPENNEEFKKAQKKVSKMVYPSEHQNDFNTYMRLCEERGLKPRFSSFLNGEDGNYTFENNPNYMKLVNETRQSDAQTGYLTPQFDMDAALESFERFKNKGGFYGGWWQDKVELDAESTEVANDIIAIANGEKQFEDIKYGEGYVDFEKWLKMWKERRRLPNIHGTGKLLKFAFTPDQMEKNILTVDDDKLPITSKIPTSKDIQNQKVAEVLKEMPKEDEEKGVWRRKFNTFVHEWVDHLDALVRLADTTKNREIENKADYAMLAPHRANQTLTEKRYRFIVDGKNSRAEVIGESLNDILGDLDRDKMKTLGDYVYHWRNVDSMTAEERMGEDYKNRPVFGEMVDADDSMDRIAEIEAENPWVKERAERLWEYARQDLQMLVDAGVVSKEQYDKFQEATPHYIPIRRAVDGFNNVSTLDPNKAVKKFKGSSNDILPLDHNMIEHTRNVYRTAAVNSLHNEIMDTVGNLEGMEPEALDELFENGFNPLSENPKEGNFMYAYKDGKKYGIPVSEEIYRSLAPMHNPNNWGDSKTISKINEVRRNLITGWNPMFIVTNGIKDIQDAVYNTKFSFPTYVGAYAKAWNQIATKGPLYNLYMQAGGKNSGYINELGDAKLKSDSAFAKAFNKVVGLNEAVETAPRLAEFIASLEKGQTLEGAMTNAADVTVNFKRGGDTAKYINRNGCAFLNASIQGFNKQMRNLKMAKDGGVGAMISYMAKTVLVSGVPLFILNNLMWKDDKDYEELSDYVKANYYCVKKYGDGKFIRIHKGRIAAFYQTVLQNGVDTLEGKVKMWDALVNSLDSFMDNIAPNNPWDNFIAMPLIQAANNTTWYGGTLVPQRLQDLPDSEQYDESTDALSIAIGNLSKKVADATGANFLELSPYKVNYVLDQYSGAIGDIGLPILTQETSVNVNNPLLKGVATAFLDKFTTDSVLKNQNITDFYAVKEATTKLANSLYATDEQKLSSKYLNSVNAELNDLYHQLHETQGDKTLTNREKYDKTREIRKQMNEIAKEALANYDQIDITGDYASVGGVAYRRKEDGTWTKPSKSSIERTGSLTDEDKDRYYSTIDSINAVREDIKSKTPEGQTANYTKETIAAINDSGLSAKGKNTLFDQYYDSKFVSHVNAMGLTDEESYSIKVANKLAEGKKDANGKTISNSKAEAVAEAYDELGLLDDVIKYIKENDIAPSEMGLSKTVYNKLLKTTDYAEAYKSTIGKKTSKKSSKSSKSSKGSKSSGKSSSSKSSKKKTGSFSSKNTASGVKKTVSSPRNIVGQNTSINTRPQIKKDSLNTYFNAYQNVFGNMGGAKKARAGGSSTTTCPNCGNRIPGGTSRCPVCGHNL